MNKWSIKNGKSCEQCAEDSGEAPRIGARGLTAGGNPHGAGTEAPNREARGTVTRGLTAQAGNKVAVTDGARYGGGRNGTQGAATGTAHGARNSRSRPVRLNLVLFPIPLLMLFPIIWVGTLPASFFLDGLVLFVALKAARIDHVGKAWLSTIWGTWLLGFLADLIAAGIVILPSFVERPSSPLYDWLVRQVWKPASMDPLSTLPAFLFVALAVLIAALLIYLFNRTIVLKRLELNDRLRHRIALALAILTPPYILFLPTHLLT
ncbi:MAG: hypothetical protein Q4A52_03430 [Bacillota bacterium]|nr:hypothetical protein [Bacillota bacterium]